LLSNIKGNIYYLALKVSPISSPLETTMACTFNVYRTWRFHEQLDTWDCYLAGRRQKLHKRLQCYCFSVEVRWHMWSVHQCKQNILISLHQVIRWLYAATRLPTLGRGTRSSSVHSKPTNSHLCLRCGIGCTSASNDLRW